MPDGMLSPSYRAARARLCAAILATAGLPIVATAATAPPEASALYTDPPADVAHPAKLAAVSIPSGDAKLVATAYLASGAGPHPTLVLLHGLPGHEKNGDLAQAVRRAGWNVVLFSYRGAWGTAGEFSFQNCIDDARNVLAYLRQPEHARPLRVDTRRIVLGGHSMGGWVTAMVARDDPELAGAIMISSGDFGAFAAMPRPSLIAMMSDSRDGLNASPESMADEIIRRAADFSWHTSTRGLARAPLLVLRNAPGPQSESGRLVAAVTQVGGRVKDVYVRADHTWNTARVRLASEVIFWLEALP